MIGRWEITQRQTLLLEVKILGKILVIETLPVDLINIIAT